MQTNLAVTYCPPAVAKGYDAKKLSTEAQAELKTESRRYKECQERNILYIPRAFVSRGSLQS